MVRGRTWKTYRRITGPYYRVGTGVSKTHQTGHQKDGHDVSLIRKKKRSTRHRVERNRVDPRKTYVRKEIDLKTKEVRTESINYE